MKPVKITMTAFGPYKNREIIDFIQLDGHRLFVISGNTGAGKTTIFDAICFALYGEASGEERKDTQLLRSHFADDATHTSVELVFRLHNHTYRVFRQIPHVKTGNKTSTGGVYELYEIKDGKEVPCVDRFHVSDINDKIEQILGLSKDQFSQIVMLPQGEFRKLLTSETENKEEILRRIFKTAMYKRLAELFKEKKQLAQKQYDQQTQERNFIINRIDLPEREGTPLSQVLAQEHYNPRQIIEALDIEVAHYKVETEKNTVHQQEAAKNHHEKTVAYHRAESVNEKFAALDQKKEKKAQLDAEVPQIEEKQTAVERAEKADHLKVYELHLHEAKQDEAKKQQVFQAAIRSEDMAAEKMSSARSIYEEEEANAEKRDQVNKELDRLNRFLPIVADVDRNQADLKKLMNAQLKLAQELESLDITLKKEKEQKQRLVLDIKKLDEAVVELAQKEKSLNQLRNQWKVANDFVNLQDKINSNKKDVHQKLQDYQAALNAYNQLESRWLEGQAGVIATHLHDGMPCPVCGSVEHPAKGAIHKDLPTKEVVEQLGQEKTGKETLYRRAQGVLDHLLEQREEKENEVREYGLQVKDMATERDRLKQEGKQRKEEIDVLYEKQETLKRLKENSETLEEILEEKSNRKDKLEKEFQTEKLVYEKQKVLYDQSLEQIPEDLRDLKQLKQYFQKTEQLKLRLEQRWKEAQERYQKAKDAATTAKANKVNAEKQQAEADARAEKAAQAFAEALKKNRFADEADYRQAKIEENEQAQIVKKIEAFRTERSNLSFQIRELEKELENRSRVDLDSLGSEVERLRLAEEEAKNALQRSERYKVEGNKLIADLTEAAEKVNNAEQFLLKVTDLYDVVRGDNARKISFERYLQIEFLEQIVQSANMRLKRLSNGQFYLIRSDRLEKRGRQSGLGLDVYDSYTGQTRDVKSLSGGEKFNASLCLALGMADVIQAFEGGVSIETMFIDEGFGSLDEESLTKAIDALIELQKSGRMVGVISHVRELKNAIPAVLEVNKAKEGHSYTRFSLK